MSGVVGWNIVMIGVTLLVVVLVINRLVALSRLEAA